MAGKNNHRYGKRKRINKIKHEVKPLFSEPAKYIENWEQLDGLQNDNISVDKDMCNGWIKPKNEVPDDEFFTHNVYLSTHTFYGRDYYWTTAILRYMGFNIQLANWDGETVWCKQ